jgi:hypothetical protein
LDCLLFLNFVCLSFYLLNKEISSLAKPLVVFSTYRCALFLTVLRQKLNSDCGAYGLKQGIAVKVNNVFFMNKIILSAFGLTKLRHGINQKNPIYIMG